MRILSATASVVGLLLAYNPNPNALTAAGGALAGPGAGKAPFGTIVEQWTLPTAYNGAGITYVADSDLFYYTSTADNGVYWFDPSDGSRGLAFATGASERAWGIHFDESDGTFWITDVNASSVALWRQYDSHGNATGTTYDLFAETGSSTAWWASGDYDATMDEVWVPRVGDANNIDRFDLDLGAGNIYLGEIANPDPYSLRGLGFMHRLMGDGSARSMILCNWYTDVFGEANLSGSWIQYINPGWYAAAGNDIYEPLGAAPTDSVFAFVVTNSDPDQIWKVALGYTWEDVSAHERTNAERGLYDIRVGPVVRGEITVRYLVPRPGNMEIAMFDESGRLVKSTIQRVRGSGTLSLPAPGAGLYFVRVSAGVYEGMFKIVVPSGRGF